MDKRVRITSATLRTDKRMRDLIALLSDRQPITVCELGILMDLSGSGIRKYCYRLIDAGIVSQGLDESRQVTLTLTASEKKLKDFMREYSNPERPKQRSLDLQERATPGRMLHIMADDVEFKVKLNDRLPIKRDPLVEALFGPAPASQIVTVLELA